MASKKKLRLSPSGPYRSKDENGSGVVVQQAWQRLGLGEGGQAFTEEPTEVIGNELATLTNFTPGNRIVTLVSLDVELQEWVGDVNFSLGTQIRLDGGDWVNIISEALDWPPSAGPDVGEDPTWNTLRVRLEQFYGPTNAAIPPDFAGTIQARAVIFIWDDAAAAEIPNQLGGYLSLMEVS